MDLRSDHAAVVKDWSSEPDQCFHSSQAPKPKANDIPSQHTTTSNTEKPQKDFDIHRDHDERAITDMSEPAGESSNDVPETPEAGNSDDERSEQHSHHEPQPAGEDEDERQQPQVKPRPTARARSQSELDDMRNSRLLTLFVIISASLWSSFALAFTLIPSITDRLLAVIMIMLWGILFSDIWRATDDILNNWYVTFSLLSWVEAITRAVGQSQPASSMVTIIILQLVALGYFWLCPQEIRR